MIEQNMPRHSDGDNAGRLAAEQQARRDAEREVWRNQEFLALAAHELRTPLAILLGQIYLLKGRADGSFSPQDREAVHLVRDQALKLNALVERLLDLSQLQTDQFWMERVPVDVVALTRQVVKDLQPTLTAHAITLDVAARSLTVLGDRVRLTQVLHNLLSNAVKYSPVGGRITLKVAHEGRHALVAVADGGIGIPADALSQIAQRFYRAPNARRLPVKGVGVGLYVVQEIIGRHGGQLQVESAEGVGSTFTVRLPLAPTDPWG